MKPLKQMPPEVVAAITTVISDIDDTLTTHGKLTAQAYTALEDLKASGLRVLITTGRPAAWCDHIARMWPVDGVVGENGALFYWYDQAARKVRVLHRHSEDERRANADRLARVRELVLREVPEAGIASDQFSRLYDLAIDFAEDVPPLPPERIRRIVDIMQAQGMTAKVSSIHVNGWFGRYDKLGMTALAMKELFGLKLEDERGHCVYAGDSPNDSPLFDYIPHSVGVANVLRFAGSLEHPPKYVTEAECGAGFAELAAHLIRGRAARGI